MRTKLEPREAQFQVKFYKIQYPASAYRFPRETLIKQSRFDDKHIHVELTDGRVVSVPLRWIPTLDNAAPEEREKYELSRDRTMLIWDPEKCAINDELRITDYMGPNNNSNHDMDRGLDTRRRPANRRSRNTTRIQLRKNNVKRALTASNKKKNHRMRVH